MQAPYVAIEEATSSKVGKCGPYGYATYAQRFRTTVRVKVYEARTSKLVGEKSFTGSSPSCPREIMVYGGEPENLYGDGPKKAIDAWLARWKN